MKLLGRTRLSLRISSLNSRLEDKSDFMGEELLGWQVIESGICKLGKAKRCRFG